MRRGVPIGFIAVLAAGAVLGLACASDRGGSAMAPPPPAGGGAITLQEVARGYSAPVFLTAPPGDTARLFVVEKPGRVRIVKSGVKLPASFLDVSDLVSNASEQGLLGLAFDPNYATNRRFFVYYTDVAGDTRVVRYEASVANPDSADESTESLVIAADQPFANHNGGMIVFGPNDGMLYIGLGDGGSGGDPDERAQNRGDLLGSTLRLDVSGAGPYAIPADNPFVGSAGMRGELWDYGLRNPWRFSFDRSNGDLYIGDVGQGDWEEIDVSTAAGGGGRGVNYGWDVVEGTHCFEPASGCVTTSLRMPAIEYSHTDGNCVIGGYVYRGARVPALQGLYFYSDTGGRFLRSFRWNGTSATQSAQWTVSFSGSPYSFGEDADGDLYLLTSAGIVYRFDP
ncbi:MAG: glucose dehydrogenase [Candidatus Eisenbacteria bacterium]|uniref:Glucose dehydrogenase n=1 Tax=Eiseniibacteriota bacterium TaxID=2212470 RepID=A0A849SJ26_UNCEI|nr:glucose dehydrogenase [Candidatus Eisenbacteria bacterium]